VLRLYSSVVAPRIVYQLDDLLYGEVDRLSALLDPLLELLDGGELEFLQLRASLKAELFAEPRGHTG
jgi:hypothetical protein